MFETRAFEGIKNLIGPQDFKKVQDAHVLIIGIGGVGSWVAESLVRSGIGNITIMDMDDICVSNINRQIHATAQNIGELKVDEMKKRLLSINPQLNCHTIFDFFTQKNASLLLEKKYNFIVDAIDSVNSKAYLHDFARKKKLSILCIGGSGSRLDPTKIKVDDLNKSVNDKLLKQLKRKLRKEFSFSKFETKPFKIPTVFSTEIPLEPKKNEQNDLKQNKIQNCQSGLGSASFVTASFGLVATSFIIKEIIKS